MSESGTGCDKTEQEQLFVTWQRGERGGWVEECNGDVEVLSCIQNGLTRIRFD